MEQREIEKVAQVLAEWNPLGTAADDVSDLDGYRTEAIDIISVLRMNPRAQAPATIVMQVLNQAFDLSLMPSECSAAAQKISAILAVARK